MSWRRSRQTSIVIVILVFVVAILVIWFYFNRPEPSCFDDKKNQNELGVDCGGICQKVCPVEALPLSVLWVRVIEVTPGSYTVIAQIENPNKYLGLPNLKYNLTLINSTGKTVAELDGQDFANPAERFLIFKSGILATPQVVARAFIKFPDQTWSRLDKTASDFTVRKKTFQALPTPRLVAEVFNSSIEELKNISIPVVLSDEDGNVITSSATVVDSLASGQSVEIYYTWRLPLPKEPVFFDFYPHQNLF